MVGDASEPTTPPRPSSPDTRAPPPVRQSQRVRNPSERARANSNTEGEGGNTVIAEGRDQNGTRKKGSKGSSLERPAEIPTATVAIALGAVMKKLDELTGTNETRSAKLEKQNEALLQAVQQYEARITELVQVVQHNETRIAKLETQNQTLLDMMTKSANEQVKMTQSWAQVAARAPAPPTSSPTPPGSSPSLPNGPMNPHSSVSQTSLVSRSAIILDLARTTDRTSDFPQLKDKINAALRKHEATKEVRCTGLQRRAGGEDQVKITLASEEAARQARQNEQWLREPRFHEARILGEQWYPIKVDRVNRSAISPNSTTEITQDATEAIAQENGVRIQRIRWLSKASDKTYGSVVVFLADHQEAEALLAKGMMDFGGEMAYTRTYERRQGPTRCFKCHGYGHVEARCKATAAVCGKCAQTGHPATDCTSTRIRCATCQGPHQAIDRTCPKYLEMLRRFNPVERYG